ncbi:MAG: J domain-containing protein [Cyanobacteria bacterium P01_A01_bin.123]
MAPEPLSHDWLKQFSDPYATLGLSVAADERRLLKRYRQVAKRLHPDVQANNDESTQELARQIITRLVNPAYQRLKIDKSRSETLATLRFKVRRLTRQSQLNPTSDLAKALFKAADTEVDVFYEQALDQLAEGQYESVETFEQITPQLAELNLVYLRRKMGEPVIREKRTGLVAASTVPTAPVGQPKHQPNDAQSNGKAPLPPNYAERHIERAQEYLQKGNHNQAVQELRDAIRIEPSNSHFHSLLGRAYLMQKLEGMAKVHFRQALKLDSNNALARKYAPRLGIELQSAPNGNTKGKRQGNRGFFGLFQKK